MDVKLSVITRDRERYFLAVILFLLIFWNYWIPTYLHAYLPNYDFNLFYVAGLVFLQHENPYAVTRFIYPPTSIPFYAVFAFFGLKLATQLWTVTYFAIFAIALLGICFTLDSERRSIVVLFTVIFLSTSYPLLYLMQLGQSDLLICDNSSRLQ